MRRQVAVEVICFLFILLFVYAAISKLLDVQKFRIQIGQSPLLTSFGSWLAWFIPSIELLIAVLLTTNRFRLVALYSAFGLMVVFTTYITAILYFSLYVPCSCGGILEQLGWREHLVFNAAFSLLGGSGVMLYPAGRKTEFVPSELNG